MDNFEKWENAFRSQNLYAFNGNENALLWLKVRAICRGKHIEQFLNENGLTISATKISDQNTELFLLLEQRPDAMLMLDKYLKDKNHEWYVSMGVDEEQLKNDLYKIQHYTWGGDQNNSLDKYLINRYVKTISQYDELAVKQHEIADNAWNYVQNSWYNNWTSYLIEALFKRHHRVISAVGEIKSVDFFIDNFPLDLKVTFFPAQFMDEKLKTKLGKSLLSWLKSECKKLGINANKSDSTAQQIYTLTEKLIEQKCYGIINHLNEMKRSIIKESENNPMELMTWLYEKQGEMRFGAENRIFVILSDTTNWDQSWKMKRAFSLIEPQITHYLDTFTSNSLKEVYFSFKGQRYTSLADTIFVIK